MDHQVRSRRKRPSLLQSLALVILALIVCAEGSYLALAVELDNAGWAVTNVLLVVIVAAIGFVLAFRRSDRPVGWLLMGAVLAAEAKNVAEWYLLFDYHLHHGHLPVGVVAAIAAQGVGLSTIVLLAPGVLLLPDGRIPSPRWRWVWRACLFLSAVLVLGRFISTLSYIGQHIHVNGSGVPTNTEDGFLGYFGFSFLAVLGLIPIWVSLIAYQVVNFRRSTGVRRQQMKWLLAGAVICIASLMVTVFSTTAGHYARLGIAAFPIALLITVFRYRLYEIDRVMSRTVSYLLLTALVAGTYIGIVTLTQGVLRLSSPIAVAVSTLCAFALFAPLRRKIQRIVDRRFNRARYDAEKIVSGFTVRMREAIGEDAVKSELLSTVALAVEPLNISVWTASGFKADAGAR